MLPVVPLTDEQLEVLATRHAAELKAGLPERLNGPDLLALQVYPQVRHFILFQLFQEWRAYMQKVRHPYFDNEHPEVTDALRQLEITLSHHISVPNEAMEGLLKKAVYNSLWLILHPEDALTKYFFGHKEVLDREKLERFAVYIHCYDFLVQGLVDYYVEKNETVITLADFQDKLRKLAQRYADRVGSLENYRAQEYKNATGLALDELPAVQQPAAPPAEEALRSQPRPEPQQSVAPPRAEPRVETRPLASSQSAPPAPTRTATPVHEPGRPLRTESIPLHKQFQYVQKVFGGDAQRFKDTLNALNLLPSYEEAEKHMQTRIFNMPENAHDDKINKEFMEFVATRFGR